ncbi:MAG: AGE family epimerase/isomerase [Elusimicrobia bacterium]|nr:AGE family epimerase/isomerase [Elusimicrobiota bacterium]
MNKYLKIYKKELFESVIPFWLKHSVDEKYGGYFTCLTENGTVYDTKKYMWLQGRQSWFFSKMYNTVEKNPEWLKMAKIGVDFMRKYGRTPDGRVCFSLTREGLPYNIQRKIFSECFYIMALSEYAKATNNDSILKEALDLFDKVLIWSKDSSLVGRPKLSGVPAGSSLSIPMTLLNLIYEIRESHPEVDYKDVANSCLQEILLHVREDLQAVLENVGTDGSLLLDSPEGRLLNPGHAIETAWFLIHYIEKEPNEKIKNLALKMIDWSMEKGWDKKYGGLFYFMDIKNMPLMQLEWSMKLWWPHTEAIYALLLAYSITKNKKYLKQFKMVHDWAFTHFQDKKYGDWYAYLDRQGNKTHNSKGGAYKACFHLPRCLLYSINLIENKLI